MFCQNCGASLADGAKFCPECGARQEPAAPSASAQNLCPFCGEALEADSVFCESCGRSLSDPVSSAGNAPRGKETSAPPPIPPMPESASPQTTRPAAQPSSKKSNALPIVIAVILGVALLAFVIVRYGGSIRTLLKPDQGMPQDFDVDVLTVETPIPDAEATAIPETTPEPIEESTPVPEITPEPEDETVSESTPEPIFEPEAQPESEPVSEPEPEDESSPRYDPLDFETFDPATLADFQWVTYDIAHGILPSGMDRLEDYEEIEGGWKLYIIDDPDGEYGSTIERLCRCAFGVDANGKGIGIRWDYVHNYGTDEGWEDNTPDSFYYGPWEYGVFSGMGAGSVTITDFWYANGHEYAVGRMTWPDGIPSVMFLVRP